MRRLVGIGLAALVVLGGALAYALYPGFHHQPPDVASIPAELNIDVSGSHVECDGGIAWSPDGRQIALLGSSQPCRALGQEVPLDPYAVIYDARTGKPAEKLAIGALLQARGVQVTSQVATFAWTPDGQAIAVQLTLEYPQMLLAIVPLHGGAPRLIAGTMPPYSPQHPNPQPVWNLQAGSMGTLDAPLPPALSYRWTAGGKIVAAQPFPAAVPAGATPPAGAFTGRPTPAGGFSFWHAGQVESIWPNTPAGPPAGQAFTATPVLWSPDRHFVTFGVGTEAALHLAQPVAPAMCARLGLPAPCTPPTAPLPDAAVATILHAVQQPTTFTAPDGQVSQTFGNAYVAWSPDGKHLATILPGAQFIGGLPQQRTTISVFSTATGQVVKTIQYQCPAFVPHVSSYTGCQGDQVSWSPTGDQLAFHDAGAVRVLVWNMQALKG